jgi:predicted  nucleic acid-binding Zn-ribbon protein
MNADLEQLVSLQAIDLEIKRLKAELAAGPQRVARVEADLREAQSSLTAAQKSLRSEEVLRRGQESDVEDRRGKIARLSKQMESATSGAQISALEHEISFAKAAIAKLEDEELASLERTEASEALETTDKGLVGRLSQLLEGVKAEVAEKAAAARIAVAEREAERTALRATIGETPLSTYDRIAKSRGTGLSEATDHKCSACQMMVRPQRWNDLTSREHEDEIFTCETCGRMLFCDRRRDAPGLWAAGDRLKAAAEARP